MSKDKRLSRVDQLLEMAWNTSSPSRAVSIAKQILEISPGNTDALIIIADNTDDSEGRIGILNQALESLDTNEEYSPENKELMRLTICERIAYTYFSLNKFDEALSYCEKSMAIIDSTSDPDALENYDDMKALYYRILIERREWQKILAETMRDETHNLAWAYSRLAAAWMTSPGNTQAVCANMFWDAVAIAPEVPFYMLGYLEEPGDDSDPQEHEDFGFALMYYDILSVSEDFFHWFTRGAILFGLLTNRFDGREREYVLDVIDTLGGYEEYEKMSGVIVEGDDRAVIEMLAANKCLSE